MDIMLIRNVLTNIKPHNNRYMDVTYHHSKHMYTYAETCMHLNCKRNGEWEGEMSHYFFIWISLQVHYTENREGLHL